MTQTPAEVAPLLNKMVDASKAFADTEKSRADADKVRADTDNVRSETEADKRLGRTSLMWPPRISKPNVLAMPHSDKYVVLVLGGAKAETYQVVVKRRALRPRIQTSTPVEADYVLVQNEYVKAAGHATAAFTYAGKIDKDGTNWAKVGALPAIG